LVGEETVVLPAGVLLDNHLGIGCAGFPQGDLKTIEVKALVTPPPTGSHSLSRLAA